VNVTLSPVVEEDIPGKLTVTARYPEIIVSCTLTIENLNYEMEITTTDLGNNVPYSTELPTGNYRLTIRAANGSGNLYNATEVCHIYSGLESVWEFDLAEIIPPAYNLVS
jgi:hypothetical protein